MRVQHEMRVISRISILATLRISRIKFRRRDGRLPYVSTEVNKRNIAEAAYSLTCYMGRFRFRFEVRCRDSTTIVRPADIHRAPSNKLNTLSLIEQNISAL